MFTWPTDPLAAPPRLTSSAKLRIRSFIIWVSPACNCCANKHSRRNLLFQHLWLRLPLLRPGQEGFCWFARKVLQQILATRWITRSLRLTKSTISSSRMWAATVLNNQPLHHQWGCSNTVEDMELNCGVELGSVRCWCNNAASTFGRTCLEAESAASQAHVHVTPY